jgi:hypothetical protein
MPLSREEKIQAILSGIDNIGRRMDRFDADDRRARADALGERKTQLAGLERELLAQTTQEVVDFRIKADEALAPYSYTSPPPVLGERTNDYRRRVLVEIQNRLPTSDPLYKINVAAIRDDATLNVFERQIIDAAIANRFNPEIVPRGTFAERDLTDHAAGGPRTTGFIGRDSFIKELSHPGRKVKRLIAADSRTGQRTVLIGPPENTLQ